MQEAIDYATNAKTAEIILKSKLSVNLNMLDEALNTPLMLAVLHGYRDVVNLFLTSWC